MAEDEDTGRVQVVTSTRMADPDRPDDVMHGKRFTDPSTGKPASIVDILTGMGALKPQEAPEDEGPAPDAPGGPRRG